ncbi:hypothetical protein pb186bvf_009988 [Paramecium bursaria]
MKNAQIVIIKKLIQIEIIQKIVKVYLLVFQIAKLFNGRRKLQKIDFILNFILINILYSLINKINFYILIGNILNIYFYFQQNLQEDSYKQDLMFNNLVSYLLISNQQRVPIIFTLHIN